MSDRRVWAATMSRRPFSVTGAPSASARTASALILRDRAYRGAATTASRAGRELEREERTLTTHRVTLIPGDGVGPELVDATRRCVEATGVAIEWDVQEAGGARRRTRGDAAARTGARVDPRAPASRSRGRSRRAGGGFRSVNVALRTELDLFACVRPCRSYPGVRSRYEGVDLVIVRENTEDLYTGIEFEQGHARRRRS